jgi:hypothetical protein
MRARTIWAAALVCLAVQGADSWASVSAPASAHGAKMSLATSDADQIFPGGFEQLFTLSISNYLDWCSISVNNGPAAADDPIVSFEQDRVIALHGDTADANYFVWGFWTGTDAGNHDANMDATVTMSSDRNVTACCPDIGLSTCP